jgi:hypothetical protein
LAIHEGIAKGKFLHHANEGIVDRTVPVGVILAQYVADDGRRLLIGTAGHQTQLVHTMKDSAVYRLEAVSDVGEGSGDDDAHRVIDERLLHLFFDEPGQNTFA